jgi:hypothetical protein
MTTTFPIAPAGNATWVLLLLAIPVLLVGVAIYVMAASLVGSRNASFELDAHALTLRGDMYGRSVPRAVIQTDAVRVIDLDREPKLTPVRRTFGTALPGYRSGWFRLADGEKALLYVTDRSRVVYVPTTEGYSILLSPSDPEGLAASLREAPHPVVR